MQLHVRQECIIQTVYTEHRELLIPSWSNIFPGNRKLSAQNDLIHIVQLGGTVAVTLTRTLPELSPVQAFSCTWM